MATIKLTKTGYRISKNGAVITGIEKDAVKSDTYKGALMKEVGTYYYFNRKQGSTYIYLP